MTLPNNSWKKLLPSIKYAGENGFIGRFDIGDDFEFLSDIGVLDAGTGELTSAGREIFESEFIRRDERGIEALRVLLLQFPPTIAIQQYLWGVADVDTGQALTVLKAAGYWDYATLAPMTHFLDLLNLVGILNYNRGTKRLRVLISPDTPSVPKSIFIDPKRPFSNIVWIKRILDECDGFIYWLDKHFQKEALEWLWAIADASKIKEIKILSLDLGDANLNGAARKSYRDFKREMESKGISVSWAIIASTQIKDSHDRWIIGGNNYLRNVPNVNAISSGQKSEMILSDNFDAVLELFKEYYAKATALS